MQVLTSHKKHKMTLDLHRNACSITRNTGKHGVHNANVSSAAEEKPVTKNNDNNNDIHITSSALTLNKHQKQERNATQRHLQRMHKHSEIFSCMSL